ncbi:MAG: DUF1501 domain-containing protein [Planctomycetales bacterium]|nr:DUF1501 domain-containing protein [Planctomycetales bacterium]
MRDQRYCESGHLDHAFRSFGGTLREGLCLSNRRNMVKASLAGLAGLSFPELLRQRALATQRGESVGSHRSVILLWMTGGPSHIDMWDMKPDRPLENRGPFSPISTAIPGEFICEHLPKQAAMLDKFTVIRSVDCRHSNHEPNQVMQTGHREAAPRANPKGDRYPAIGSVIGKLRGANHPGVPPYIAFQRSSSHIAYAGYLGQQHNPFIANDAARLPVYDLVGKDTGKVSDPKMFRMPRELNFDRIEQRLGLLRELDQMRRELDSTGMMDAMDAYQQQALDLLAGGRVQKALDLSSEPTAIRERYGEHLWCQQALLARRLVEAGTSFVTIDLSYHTASGTWDNHGDNIPPYGGISKGLRPLLPLFDHLITTLVTDLDQRGLLDEVLVVAMGEFGRTPQMGTQGSTDGRNHWPHVMSMCLAGGGMRHGQVIGSTDADGGAIKSRPVTPGDLAATIYHHMQVPLHATYDDDRGRPTFIVQENGKPISELI